MSKIIKENWSTEEQWQKVYSHLENNKLDTGNVYYYVELLEGQHGLIVNRQRLGQWLTAKTSKIVTAGFEL